METQEIAEIQRVFLSRLSDYLLPNLYFHITTAYAILRKLGVPLGKADYMSFLTPYVNHESAA